MIDDSDRNAMKPLFRPNKPDSVARMAFSNLRLSPSP
jgi:hypothetical protein